MNEILYFVFVYLIPAGLVTAVVVACIVGAGLALTRPHWIAIGFALILAVFKSSSTYGLENVADQNLLYVKGSRTLFFSFFEIALFGAWLLTAVVARPFQGADERAASPLAKWYIALALVLAAHVLAGLFDPKYPTIFDFHDQGVMCLMWQGMFVTLLLGGLREPKQLVLLGWLLLICAAGRDAYGLARWLFLGGDPQNAYQTSEGIRVVKITFWDINDSIIAAYAVGFCAWKLLGEGVPKGLRPTERNKRWWLLLVLAGVGLMAAAIPVFSARRSAQIGLFLALVMLAFLMPKGRRWPIALALALAIPVGVVVTAARSTHGGSLLERVAIDIKTNKGVGYDERRDRFYELKTAWATIQKQPLLGLGPTGQFEVRSSYGLEYHHGNYGFVHSGFGHVMLKLGLVGLALFVGLVLSYLRFVARAWKHIAPEHRALVAGSFAGMAALTPTLMIGTPVQELRTMLVMGLLMALPFACGRPFWLAPRRAKRRVATPEPANGSAPGSRVNHA